MNNLIQKIKDTARKKNAVILAHNYQNPEIQDIADITGDSLELSRKAADAECDMIVFCGVHFMAESAKILSPLKTVLLPVSDAGCPMADMVDPEGLAELKRKNPGAKVVTYINSSAAVKALSDVICTSANAVDIVQRIDADKIIFTPDRNLASYVQRFTKKEIIPWNGFCPTHEKFTLEELNTVKAAHPDAVVIVHPECRPEVVDAADHTLSTGGMVRFAEKASPGKVIVATEIGMLHKLKKVNPAVEFIAAHPGFICPNMKKTTLEKLLISLTEDVTRIEIDPATSQAAKRALELMLKLSSPPEPSK